MQENKERLLSPDPTRLQTRRHFLDWLLGISIIGWVVSLIYPLTQYVVPPAVPEAKVSSLKVGALSEFPPNSSKVFKFGNAPAIIVRDASGEFRALSAVCTHLNCTVQYRDDWKLIWCACHNGRYDLNGRNIAGPPPRPLEAYKVVVQKDEVYVTREA